MKKRLMLLFSVICVLCCALAFAACGGTESAPPHEHTFTQAWSGDGTYHWHAATCGHTDEVSGYGEHSWDDGVCTVCKYVGGVEALEYTLNSSGDSYSVTGVGHCGVAELTIPSVYNGLPVTSIGDHAFSSCAQLESVVIPDSVASIGDYAFNGCHWLARVIIGDGTEKIGYSAFSGCTNLVQLVLGSGVTSIGEYAFMSCYKLVEVYDLSSLGLDAGETEHGYAAYYALNVYRAAEAESGLKEENGYLFYEDGATVYLMGYTGEGTQLTLPDSYRGSGYVIYAYAFAENAAITKATISGGAVSVGANAFYRCTGLTEVALADGVSSIGASAFYGCTALVKASIGSGVTSIGVYAFYGCTALEELVYDAAECADLSAYNYVFYNAGKGGAGLSVTIGADVTHVPDYLFHPCSDSYYMPKLVHVQFTQDSACTRIGDGAFYGCTQLTEIALPASIAQLGRNAFLGCTGLERVTFAQLEGWTVIGEDAVAVPAPENLSDPSAAAEYLTETYCAYTWRRKGEG